MALEISGKVSQVLQLETGEGKNGPWKKQSFIIEFMDGNYPKKLSIQAWGDKTDAIRNLQQGDDVKVAFNIESREYNGRWYTDVKAWKIEAQGSGASQNPSGESASAFAEPDFGSSGSGNSDIENDLPF